MRGGLWVFGSEGGGGVEAGGCYVGAAVVLEEGVGEGEVAFAEKEDFVVGGEGDCGGGVLLLLLLLLR